MFKQESMTAMLTLCIGPSPGLSRKVKILRADWFSTLCLSNANPKISNLLAQWEHPGPGCTDSSRGALRPLLFSIVIKYNLEVFVTSIMVLFMNSKPILKL